MADDVGRIMNGRGANSNTHAPTGTETIFPIPVTAIPAGRKATYARIVCADRPEKENPRRVRLTVDGDQIDFPGDVSTRTSGLATVKLHRNSTSNRLLLLSDRRSQVPVCVADPDHPSEQESVA